MKCKIKTGIKFISLIAIIMIVVSPGFAFKSGIVKSKSWISGGDEKGFPIEGHIEYKSIISSSEKESPLSRGSSSARASARTNDIHTKVNTNYHAEGSHSYYINNTSAKDLYYTVDIKLCANSTYCFHNQDRVGVPKNGSFSASASSYLTSMFSYEGNYDLIATTSVSGDTSASDTGRATIYVRRNTMFSE